MTDKSIKQIAKGNLMWKSEIIQQATQIVIDARGNSGNVIRELSTGIIYPSQNAAAKALGLDPASLSKHLTGSQIDAGGFKFEKILDGSAPKVFDSR